VGKQTRLDTTLPPVTGSFKDAAHAPEHTASSEESRTTEGKKNLAQEAMFEVTAL
jgi:hypothetical protein